MSIRDWKSPMRLSPPMRLRAALTCSIIAALTVAAGAYRTHAADSAADKPTTAVAAPANPALELSESQLQLLSIDHVSEQVFPVERRTVGSIDFNEDMNTDVYPPYQGRIAELFVQLGDNVRKGQPLFTIESPDLIQAESTLIAAAGVLDLTGRALERARQLRELQGVADKDYEQAVSDQQTAEGALKAARDAVAVFGKSPEQIDRILRTRTIDPYLTALSPVGGRITARNAAPGVFVQPGIAPAPFSVADISRLWMNANVAESDMPLIQRGQPVHVSVMAYPGRTFDGRVSAVGARVDAQLHRGLVRAEIEDPTHELLPGMLASFLIVTGSPVTATAVPLDSVVREGDGSMTVWVTKDRRHFTQRTIRVGLQSGGYDQVLEGLERDEQVVIKGALYLDNIVNGGET